MVTTNDTHRTEWSLPVRDDLPRDTLQAQLEVYGETILLRGFEADRNWVRTASADEIANVSLRFSRRRLRLRSWIGRPLRPVGERPADGANAHCSRRGPGAGPPCPRRWRSPTGRYRRTS